MISFKNHEHYNDPTAYFALLNATKNTPKNKNSKKKFYKRNLKARQRKQNIK